MEFEGQYLTYSEYRALGGALDQSPFNILEYEARRRINIKTQNRLSVDDIPQEVKMCEYNMINCIEKYVASSESIGGNLASESIDGYSISYITVKDVGNIIKSKEQEIDDIIRTYLLGVIYNNQHLLYCGIDDK